MFASRITAVCFVSGLVFSAGAGIVHLTNDQVSASWEVRDDQLWPRSISDTTSSQSLGLESELFTLVLANSQFLRASQFHLVAPPQARELAPNPAASRFSERLPGRELSAELSASDGSLNVQWRAILRDGSR